MKSSTIMMLFMKKSRLLILPLLAGLLMTPILHIAPPKNEVRAQYTQTVNEYYQGINWDQTESTLKNNLFKLINITNAGWSYDGLWDAYRECDVRPGGVYFWDIYSDKSDYTLNDSRINNDYSKEGDSINREHVIPQGSFNKAAPMKSDIHHVLPSDGYVNNRRSSYPHGEVVGEPTYTSEDGCKLGHDSHGKTVFEPMDQYKGDIARMYFYFVTCYENKMSSNSFDGFDKSTYPSIHKNYLPTYLKWAKEDPVSQKEIDRNNYAYSGQGNRNPFIDCPYAVGAIWDKDNALDYGNKGEYTSGTGITISKAAASVVINNSFQISATSSDNTNITWTTSSDKITLSKNTSSSGEAITVTGNAITSSPVTLTAKTTIASEEYKAICEVSVTEPRVLSYITISEQKTTLPLNGDFDFGGNVTAHYVDGSADDVTSLATFSGYDMSQEGEQTVTVSYTEDNITEETTYEITVSEITSITQRVSISSNSKYYQTGDITMSGSSSEASTQCSGFSISWLKNNGSNGIVYTYDEMRVYSNHSFTITPKSDCEIENIVLTMESSYVSDLGDKSFTNCTKSVSGDTITLTPTIKSSAIGFSQSSQTRIHYLEVTYSNGSTPLDELQSITLDTTNVKKDFVVNESFTYEGLVVIATYSISSPKEVTPTSVSSPDMSKVGTKPINVSYSEGGITKYDSYEITVSTAPITEIFASVTKSYHPGETISINDISVIDNNDNPITDFSFANDGYQFTYKDAASGGLDTEKVFTNAVTYGELKTDLVVSVSRVAYQEETGTITDTLTASDLPATATSYTEFSDVKDNSEARYAGCSAKNNSNIQLKSKNSESGIVSTVSGGKIKSVKITVGSGNNTINIYGSNTAYEDATDLYSSSAGTLVGSVSSTGTVTFTADYLFVGIRSSSGAVYISKIEITYGTEGETPTNVANFIMFEDTEGQCEGENGKLNQAIAKLNKLSDEDKEIFDTDTGYVISSARERINAWAKHEGKVLELIDGNFVLNSVVNVLDINNAENDSSLIFILVTSIVFTTSIVVLLIIKRRRQYR